MSGEGNWENRVVEAKEIAKIASKRSKEREDSIG